MDFFNTRCSSAVGSAFEKRCSELDAAKIHLKQNRFEMKNVYDNVRLHMPRIETFVEIGSMAGASFYVYSDLVKAGGVAVAIDDGRRMQHRKPLKRALAMVANDPRGMQSQWIRANSQIQPTVDELKEILGGRKIDFLHIDGDHSEKGSTADWELYSPLVRKGGIVAFHDVIAKPPCYVTKTWAKIRAKLPHKTVMSVIACGRFKSQPGQTKAHKECGIGLVYV